MRVTVCRVLVKAGHEVVQAEHGIAGVNAVLEDEPDLVITDLLMPEQEGIETIQRIREIFPTLPIIAMSGAFGDDNYSPLDDARMMGADPVLEKPFTVEALVAAVSQLLSPEGRPPGR